MTSTVTPKRMFKKLSLILLSFLLLLQFSGLVFTEPAQAAVQTTTITAAQAIDDSAQYILSQDPLSDWGAYALEKAGKVVPASYLEAVKSQLVLNSGQFDKVTDYDRLVLAVKSAGGDPRNLSGYDLVEKIYNHPQMTSQGNNGVIYSLLALDSGPYTVPANAAWNQDSLVGWLLAHQNSDGGWPLANGGASNVDITAAALTALAPYKDRSDVQQAADHAVQWLSSVQLYNGGFTQTGGSTGSTESSESTSQVIIALSSLGIDARSGSFVKGGGNPLTYLFQYHQPNGGFAHSPDSSSSNGWATIQALQALGAYHAFTNGNSGSYEVIGGQSTGPQQAYVTVNVEGLKGIVAEGSEQAGTAYDAFVQLLTSNGIDYQFTDSAYGKYLTSVDTKTEGTVTAGVYGGWWGFNVKRQGEWTFPSVGLAGYNLKSGDEIHVYYSGNDSQMVHSIALNPVNPQPLQSFDVTVQQIGWDQIPTVASSVYVQIGQETVVTDAYGTAVFSQGLPAGTYDAVVTGYRDGQTPKVIENKRKISIGSTDYSKIFVEGPEGTIASGIVPAGNALEAAKGLFQTNNIPYAVVNYGWGQYLKTIQGYSDSWSTAVLHNGAWQIPSVGLDSLDLQPADDLYIYYGGYDANWNPTTDFVDSITVNPVQPNAGEAFTVTVQKAHKIWDNQQYAYVMDTSAAAGVTVKIGDYTAVTNDQGIASFSGLAAGNYTVDVTGYVDNAAPVIVRRTSSLTVASASFDLTPKATVSVTGDGAHGVLLSSQQISLASGDTPYTVLVKALGGRSVETAGSGTNLYVSGIDGLKEFDQGPLSGWMYSVNGDYKSVGANAYTVQSGDVIAWRYTLDGGADLRAGSNGSTMLLPAANTDNPAAKEVVQDGVRRIGLLYSNQLPIQQVPNSIVALHQDQKMTAEQAEKLKKELQSNTVRIEHQVAAGGEAVITDSGNEVSLEVPAGGVQQTALITVQEVDPGNRPEALSSIYEFGPSGTKFSQPVYLSIRIPIETEDYQNLALVWLNEETGQWIPIPAVVDVKTGYVTGMVDHFTKFAVIDRANLEASVKTLPAVPVQEAVDAAGNWILKAGEITDWQAYALAKAGKAVPDSYLESVKSRIQAKGGSFRLVTDLERMAMAVKAVGGQPSRIAGIDLIEKIYNHVNMTMQGTNGPIFALQVLGKETQVPADAGWNQTQLITWLLVQQNQDGGWPLVKGEPSDIDITAMAVTAMAPFMDRKDIQSSVETAVQWLSSQQLSDGGFQLQGKENSESTAQVIIALCAAGIDPLDQRFVKNGKDIVHDLLRYQQADGGFSNRAGEQSDAIATEQALLALASYQRYLQQSGNTAAGDLKSLAEAFTDKSQISKWAASYVDQAKAYGLMQGINPSKPIFAPKDPMTRAQFVVLLLHLLNAAPSSGTAGSFEDVKPGDWYHGYIVKAAAMGLINGTAANRFSPGQPITRQEMAVMLANALNLTELSVPSTNQERTAFIDIRDAWNEAAISIQAVSQHGLLVGDGQGRFLPRSPVTREMAAVAAVKAYALLHKKS